VEPAPGLAIPQLVRDEEVVDAPSKISRPRPGLLIPPRVVAGLLVEHPEGVVVTVGDELGHPGALDGQEARRPLVLLGPREVDLGVRYIQIPAPDHRLHLLELLEIREEIAIP